MTSRAATKMKVGALVRNTRFARIAGVAAVLCMALVLAASLGGCKKATSSTNTPAVATAQSEFKVAQTALATAAPDAKLLLVQTAQVVTATSTPIWEYIVGSPSSDKLYAVVVQKGVPQAQEYGTANLGKEWASVPASDTWKIDSDQALAKAKTVYPNAKDGTLYAMGLITYIPKSAVPKAGSKTMTWFVQFDPSTRGNLSTSTVEVNATTGEASLAK